MATYDDSKHWTWMALGVLTVLVVSFFWPCSEVGSKTRLVDRAQQTLSPFKQQLKAALEAGLATSYASAIDACRLEAPRIAADASSETVRVGRTSHRPRNPSNAPKPWMTAVIDEFRATQTGDVQYKVVAAEPGWTGYAEPIYMQPMCLGCHGKDLSPTLRNHIEELYPEDRATGFELGEFRGMFWVEIATDSNTS